MSPCAAAIRIVVGASLVTAAGIAIVSAQSERGRLDRMRDREIVRIDLDLTRPGEYEATVGDVPFMGQGHRFSLVGQDGASLTPDELRGLDALATLYDPRGGKVWDLAWWYPPAGSSSTRPASGAVSVVAHLLPAGPCRLVFEVRQGVSRPLGSGPSLVVRDMMCGLRATFARLFWAGGVLLGLPGVWLIGRSVVYWCQQRQHARLVSAGHGENDDVD